MESLIQVDIFPLLKGSLPGFLLDLSKVYVKRNFFSYENMRKTGKNAVDRFLISYLVPETSTKCKWH